MQGDEGQKQQARLLLVETLEAMRIVAILLSPVTPKVAKSMTLQLGLTEDDFYNLSLKDTEWGGKTICSSIKLLSRGSKTIGGCSFSFVSECLQIP